MSDFRNVGIFKLGNLIDLIQEFRISSISPHVVHAFDTAKISTAIYRRIFSREDVYMYLTGLFHDVGLVIYTGLSAPGAMSIAVKEVDVDGNVAFDLGKFLDRFDKDEIHSKVSYRIVEKFKILPEKFLKAILYHHTPLSRIDGTDEEITIANILSVADSVSQAMRRFMKWGFENVPKAIEEVLENVEMLPDVKSALKDLMRDMVTLRYCIDEKPYKEVFMLRDIEIGIDQLVELLKMMALFIDLRSPFTLRHSSAIATLSRDIAVEMFGSAFDGMIMYMAGLVHDIGKIKTPLYILHKPDKLDPHEAYVMKLHIVDTFKMLSPQKGLDEITAIASLHHERLNGSGYPWGYKKNQLSMRSRILQVADVFEALLEDRPYRKALLKDEALKIIENEVRRGKLDANVYETLNEMIKNGYEVEKNELVIFQFFEDLKDIDQVRAILKM